MFLSGESEAKAAYQDLGSGKQGTAASKSKPWTQMMIQEDM